MTSAWRLDLGRRSSPPSSWRGGRDRGGNMLAPAPGVSSAAIYILSEQTQDEGMSRHFYINSNQKPQIANKSQK